MSDASNLIAGRYEPGRRLGGSAFAEVGAARDTHLDRPVALKVLRPAALADPAAVERLRRSAVETGAVRDARIVDVYDWAAGPDGAYIAMELVDGGTLGDLLRNHGPLNPDRAVEIAATVAGGLAAVHATGAVHGALTTDSVLLTREGEPRLTATSGGVAPAGDAEEARRFAAHCAPEVLRGEAPTAAADVWSLGVVLHEALTGRLPYEGADAVAVATAVTGTAAPSPSSQRAGVPFLVDAVVARLLSHDPADRITDAATAEAELRRVGRTVAAPPTVATRAVDPQTQAMPTAAAAAVAAAAAPAPVSGDSGGAGSGTPRWIAPVLITLAVVVAAFVGWFLASRNDPAKGTVTVPNVLSLRREEAATRIERAGLSVSVREEPSDQFGAGIVFIQSPVGGKRVGENSVVVITVSSGPTTTSTSSTSTSTTTSSSTTTTSSSTSTSTTTSSTTTTLPPTTSTT